MGVTYLTAGQAAAAAPVVSDPVVSDPVNDVVKIPAIDGTTQFQFTLADGTTLVLTLDADGTLNVLNSAGGYSTLAVSIGQTTANKTVLAVKNGAGNVVFDVRGDGAMHGATGKSLAFDL